MLDGVEVKEQISSAQPRSQDLSLGSRPSPGAEEWFWERGR